MSRETISPDAHGTTEAPSSVLGIVRYLGPGMIIAASVVGSGELIGTTKTGAQAGMVLLWLIVIGCVLKVPIQLALGHYCVTSGKGTMAMLNEVPGRLGVSWVVYAWVLMEIASIAQLGGLAHGVGQALGHGVPITGDYARLLEAQTAWDTARAAAPHTAPDAPRPSGMTYDDLIWAAVAIAATILILLAGRYKAVEIGATAMVVSFTVVTVFCVVAIQLQPAWALSASDVATGFSFRLPPSAHATTTALATLGIIGMGATEIVGYCYWLRERGYGSFTGPRRADESWATRARGWMRVMRWDASCSAIVYTFATIAFFILGATILHRQGLDPDGQRMIRTLEEMYAPVFGKWTGLIFLLGSFSVLFSTLFVATATHARVVADAFAVTGVAASGEESMKRWTKRLIVALPLAAFLFMVFVRQPVTLVLISGVTQAAMLPILGGAALYFRYRKADARIAHGRIWDVLLWASVTAVTATGAWMVWHLISQ